MSGLPKICCQRGGATFGPYLDAREEHLVGSSSVSRPSHVIAAGRQATTDGWHGRLRHLNIWQGRGGSDAIASGKLCSGPARRPRSHPELDDVTLTARGTGSPWSVAAGQLIKDLERGVTDPIEDANPRGSAQLERRVPQ